MDEHEVPGEIKGETTGSTIWTILRTMLCFAAWCGAAALTFASPPRSQTNHAEYMGHVLSLKPVGYWPLNEERGTVAHDASPFKRNGTYHGHPAFREQGPILGGFAVAFGAAGKTYVEIASDRDFSQHTHRGLSVEAWMRPDTLTFPGETNEPYVYWLGKGEDGHMEWGFRFYSRETYRPNWTSAYIWNQTRLSGGKNLGAGAHTKNPPTVHAWRHVVATYDPGSKADPSAGVSLYINGIMQQGPPARGTLYKTYQIEPSAGPAPVRIGTRDLKSFFTGGLSDVAVYPRVLTAVEIRQNYRIGQPGSDAGKASN